MNRNKEDELRKRLNRLRDLEERLLKKKAHFHSANDENKTEDEVKLLEDEQNHLLIRQQELQKKEKRKITYVVLLMKQQIEKRLSRKEE